MADRWLPSEFPDGNNHLFCSQSHGSSLPFGMQISVKYATWMRVAVITGTFGFLAISIGLVAAEIHLLKKSWFALILLFAPAKAFHFSLIGLRLFPFLKSTFSASPKGIEITFPDGRSVFYEWCMIGSIKDRYATQIFEARSHTGTLLFALDYYCHDLLRFKSHVSEQFERQQALLK